MWRKPKRERCVALITCLFAGRRVSDPPDHMQGLHHHHPIFSFFSLRRENHFLLRLEKRATLFLIMIQCEKRRDKERGERRWCTLHSVDLLANSSWLSIHNLFLIQRLQERGNSDSQTHVLQQAGRGKTRWRESKKEHVICENGKGKAILTLVFRQPKNEGKTRGWEGRDAQFSWDEEKERFFIHRMIVDRHTWRLLMQWNWVTFLSPGLFSNSPSVQQDDSLILSCGGIKKKLHVWARH